MAVDFARLRSRFPVLARTTYLNSGSYGALADTVRAAAIAYLDERMLVGANWDAWVTKNEAVRAGLAWLLNARTGEIAVTASASAGINAVASALRFDRPRNKVLVSDFEFPTSAQIWHAQETRGARVLHVHPAADGDIPLEHFAALIDEQVQLVVVTHVCFRNGARLDIPGIVRLAHAHGALVMLDCYQAAGALTVDVGRLGVDFAVGGAAKYLLGTAGTGFLFVRAGLIEQLVPTNSGWFAQADIAAMDITGNQPAPNARRFEAGTPAVVNCYASAAGLGIILEVGTDVIEPRVRALTARCMDGLAAMDWSCATPRDDARRGPMVAVPARDPAVLVARLMEQGIVTSFRDNNVRASVHFYNDEGDIDTFLAALQGARQDHHPRG